MSAAFDTLFVQAGRKYDLNPALIKAVAWKESTLNPKAFRNEPGVKLKEDPTKNDASRGLMQLLLNTARGIGYVGKPEGLFDPATSIDLGAKLLASNIRQYGLIGGVSAYNGGYRPQYGFGAPMTGDKPKTITLAKDQKTGKVISSVTVLPGSYGNLSYIEKVFQAAADYDVLMNGIAKSDSVFAKTPVPGSKKSILGSAPVAVATGISLTALLVLAGVAFLLSRRGA